MNVFESIIDFVSYFCQNKMSIAAIEPSKDWPTQGNVKFEKVYMQYGADNPPVLNNLNFEIQNGWKVCSILFIL